MYKQHRRRRSRKFRYVQVHGLTHLNATSEKGSLKLTQKCERHFEELMNGTKRLRPQAKEILTHIH